MYTTSLNEETYIMMHPEIREIAELTGVITENWQKVPSNLVALEDFSDMIIRKCMMKLWTDECNTSDLAHEDYTQSINKLKTLLGT